MAKHGGGCAVALVRLAVAAVLLLLLVILIVLVEVGDQSGRYLQLYLEQHPDLDPNA